MENNIYKKIEITGTSSKSSDDAIQNALQRASKSVQNLRWFEVIETRGAISGSSVEQWQVTIKVGFTMNE